MLLPMGDVLKLIWWAVIGLGFARGGDPSSMCCEENRRRWTRHPPAAHQDWGSSGSAGRRQIRPISTGCRRSRQPEPGRHSTHQTGKSVQTNRASTIRSGPKQTSTGQSPSSSSDRWRVARSEGNVLIHVVVFGERHMRHILGGLLDLS
jgi:hypothetical protein